MATAPAQSKNYKDSVAKTLQVLSHKDLEAFAPALLHARNAVEACGESAIGGTCAEGHEWAKVLNCGRDYCPTCGKRGSDAHNRRFARILPKVQQMAEVGYFTIQFKRQDRHLFRTRAALETAGKRAAKTLKVHTFDRGLRRWDWFGDPKCPKCGKPGTWQADADVWQCKRHGGFTLDDVRPEMMQWHPHLNALVEGQWMAPAAVTALQRDLSLAILGKWDADTDEDGKVTALREGIILHYEYISKDDPNRIAKILHVARYIQKPTFLRLDWDPEMVTRLVGFRNGSWWGKWKDAPAWELEEQPDSEKMACLSELENKTCPHDKSPIVWRSKCFPARDLALALWIDYGGGYWEITRPRIVDDDA